MILDSGITFLPLVVLHLLIALSVGFLLEGVERKLYARLQGRVGPPLLQPVFDACKLLFSKESVIPDSAERVFFISAPYITVAAAVFAALLVPFGGIVPLSFAGDAIVLLYIVALSSFALALGASASGSPFCALAASREMTMLASRELPLALSVLAAAYAAGTFSLAATPNGPGIYASEWLLPLAAIAFFFSVLAEMGRAPFDAPEAEHETVGGLCTEYSGPLLGLVHVASALKYFVFASLFGVLFFPFPAGWSPFVYAAVQLGVAFAFACMTALIRCVSAGMRVHKAAQFYLSWMALLAAVQIVLVYIWRSGLVFFLWH